MLNFLATYGYAALQIVIIVLGAAVAALHLLAPLTKTTKDDRALNWLQRALTFVTTVLGKLMPKTPPAPAAK